MEEAEEVEKAEVEDGRHAALLKPRDPHLAGGEKGEVAWLTGLLVDG